MTLNELKQTDWYQERPDSIKEAIEKLPPIVLYKFKNSGKQCHIISYDEDKETGEITLTVQKTGLGGAMAQMGLGTLDTNAVFGVKLDDLEPWTDET